MTQASDDLWKALNGLRRAADNELSGESHRAASQQIADLMRLTGVQGEDASGEAADASLGFAASLAEVRRLAERDLSGNTFYLASKTLDELASFSSGFAGSPVAEHVHEPAFEFAAPPLPEEPIELASAAISAAQPSEADVQAVSPGLSFDELAAAAKARVEAAAASLGVEAFQARYAPPAYYPEVAPLELELEKRSSEPCFMPEVLPLDIEPASTSASAVPPLPREGTEAASVRDVVEAAHDVGSPAVAAVHIPDYAAPHEEAAPEAPAAAEPEVPALVHEAPAAEAAHAPEPAEPEVEHVPEHPAAPAQQAAPEPEIAAPAPAHEVSAAEPVQPVVEPAIEHAAAPAPEPVAEPAPEVGAAPPVEEKPAAAAPKKAEAGRKEAPKPKEPQKTFFSLWLDMVFGRKK